MRGNTFLAYATPFHIWKITQASECYLISLISVPLQARDYIVCDRLSVVFVALRLKAEKVRASTDVHHYSFAAYIFVYALMRVKSYSYVDTCQKSYSATCDVKTRSEPLKS